MPENKAHEVCRRVIACIYLVQSRSVANWPCFQCVCHLNDSKPEASVQSSHLHCLSRLDTLRFFRDLTQVPGPPPENDTAVVTSETLAGECSQQSTDLQICIRLSANLAPLFQNCFQTGKWQDMLRQHNLNETWSRAKAVACSYFQIWQIHSLPHLKHHAKPPSHSMVVACSGTLMY